MKLILIRKTLLSCLLFSFGTSGICQVEKSLDSKWVNATIPLKVIQRATFQEEKDLIERRRKKQIDLSELDRLLSAKAVEGHGSSIYFKIDSSHYLITAKHMLTRFVASDTTHRVTSILIIPRPYDSIQDMNKVDVFQRNGQSNVKLQSGATITSSDGSPVPNFIGHYHKQKFSLDFYGMNLVPIAIKNLHYYFTPIDGADLAIINIDAFTFDGKLFLNTIKKWGYKPIELKDFYKKSSIKSGKRIYCIGYPEESVKKFKNYNPNSLQKRVISNLYGTPMISKGLSEKTKIDSTYFHASIFTYHGFSGGPIITDNKLIGLTVGADFPLDATQKTIDFKNKFVSSATILEAIKLFQESLKSQESLKLKK